MRRAWMFSTNVASLCYVRNIAMLFFVALAYCIQPAKSEVKLTGGNGKLYDGIWHSVVIKRYGQQVLLKVDGDRFTPDVQSFLYYPPEICQSEDTDTVYVGGHDNPRSILSSKSKENYQGCLQEVYYRDGAADIIKEAISQITNIYVRIEGYILPRCNVKRNIHFDNKPPVEETTSAPTTIPVDDISQERQIQKTPVSKLSSKTVAWITGGICVGSIGMILTLACGFHILRKRYSGQFLAGQSEDRLRKSGYAVTTQLAGDDYNIMSLKRPKPKRRN